MVTSAPTETALAAYVTAIRGLLDRGGYERTGAVADARNWGREHITAYLDAHGRPDRRLTVHVAGTKGKGSTATIIDSMLRAAGAHTMLMTSPDVHSARERVRIDGDPVDHERFAALATGLLDDPATAGWSYFELLTVMGWLAGAEARCDWQVLEVGLGGRLDTTNSVEGKQVAVITPIDLEHTEILGDTIPLVAAEKAGVITGPCAVVASPMRASAIDVIREHAERAGATLHEVSEECAIRVGRSSLEGTEFDLRTPLRTYRKLRLRVIGPYQVDNAAAAILAAELAFASQDAELPEEAVRRGLAAVKLPVRMEVVRRRPLTILDAMHTPLAARRVRQALDALSLPRQRVLVLSMLRGKDIEGVVGAIVEQGETVIVAPPDSPRAAETADVARAVTAAGAIAQRARSVPEAVDAATQQVGERGLVIVAGSMYSTSEAREHLLGTAGDRMLGLR